MFCEQLDYNLLFRWFLDMNMDEPAFDHSTFTKNRDRLLEHDVAGMFFAAVVEQARERGLMSSEHFCVDGTLIEAWASLKSSRAKDETPEDRDPPDDPGNPTASEVTGDMGTDVVPIRAKEFRGGPSHWKNSDEIIGRRSSDGRVEWRDDAFGHPAFGMGPHIHVEAGGIKLHFLL